MSRRRSAHFRNAPLVEVVADVRWTAGVVCAIDTGCSSARDCFAPLTLLFPTTQLEGFLIQFGAAIYNDGFQRAERLIPPGVPIPWGQPVMRFLGALRDQTMFSTKLARECSPRMRSRHIAIGWISHLWFLRASKRFLRRALMLKRILLILPLSLHYINAFRTDLTQGKSIAEFLSEIFKIKLALPEGITKHITVGQNYKPYIVLNFPVERGTLNISVGEAIVGTNPEPALLLDLLFATTQDIQPENAKLLDAFSRAHVLLHDLFTELTKPVEHLMNPKN